MKQAIAKKAIELGFDDIRFTSARPPEHSREFEAWLKDGRHGTMGWIERNAFKRVDPAQVLNEAKSIITLATSYTPSTEEAHQPGLRGKIARYAQYADYHDVLAPRLKELSEFVNSVGGVETRTLWYVDTGPLLERDLAQRAGLGFTGKHTNLISRKIGNWFFISELITTLELDPDQPEKNRCGTCDKCITACPTGAITGPFQLDARKCISYLTIELKGSIPVELRSAIGNRIYGCDECLAVCPWNRFAKTGRVMAEHSRSDLNMPALLELLQLDKEGFKKMFAGTPIVRTKRRGLLRNVCVALGNIGDESALPSLERALGDEEPLVVEHAEWAIQEIKKRLTKRAVTEPAL
jgi:epoxyqueuosine reductase